MKRLLFSCMLVCNALSLQAMDQSSEEEWPKHYWEDNAEMRDFRECLKSFCESKSEHTIVRQERGSWVYGRFLLYAYVMVKPEGYRERPVHFDYDRDESDEIGESICPYRLMEILGIDSTRLSEVSKRLLFK